MKNYTPFSKKSKNKTLKNRQDQRRKKKNFTSNNFKKYRQI